MHQPASYPLLPQRSARGACAIIVSRKNKAALAYRVHSTHNGAAFSVEPASIYEIRPVQRCESMRSRACASIYTVNVNDIVLQCRRTSSTTRRARTWWCARAATWHCAAQLRAPPSRRSRGAARPAVPSPCLIGRKVRFQTINSVANSSLDSLSPSPLPSHSLSLPAYLADYSCSPRARLMGAPSKLRIYAYTHG